MGRFGYFDANELKISFHMIIYTHHTYICSKPCLFFLGVTLWLYMATILEFL